MVPELDTVGLFSGIGGLELGLHEAGHRTVMGCDVDEAARAVLGARFPDARVVGDVKELETLPDCDLVAGGLRQAPRSTNDRIGQSRFSQSIEVIRRGKCFHGFAWMPRVRRSTRRRLRIDDSELEPELILHLIAPLDLQRSGTHHQRRAGAMPQHQFLEDEPRLDRLAETHVISQPAVIVTSMSESAA